MEIMPPGSDPLAESQPVAPPAPAGAAVVSVNHSAAIAGPQVTATVAVPLFNHAPYIEERLESLFAQWRPGMELLLVDDASTDDGFAIAARTLARHPHIRATTVRNQRTLGAGVLGVVLKLARGDIVIQADSDDVALPGRLRATLACFSGDPTCRLVTSNAVLLSADGFAAGLHETDFPDQVFTDPRTAAALEGDQRWLGATVAFHRAVFVDLPPIDPAACPYGLDLLLPLRALMLGSHHYLSRPLVGWRQHGRNTHRLEGAQSTGLPDMERYQALEVMVHRQKLKDAEYACRQPGAKPVLAEVAEICKLRFFEKYDNWSLLRNTMIASPPMLRPDESQRPFPKSPPLVTLEAGERIDFGTAYGAAVLAGWNGFNDAEAWGAWTKRNALICLRITSPDVTALRIEVGGLGFLGRQRVSLSVGLEDWQEVELNGQERRHVDLLVAKPGIAWLVINAHDAAYPPSADSRLLGVSIHTVEAVAEPLSEPVVSPDRVAELVPC